MNDIDYDRRDMSMVNEKALENGNGGRREVFKEKFIENVHVVQMLQFAIVTL